MEAERETCTRPSLKYPLDNGDTSPFLSPYPVLTCCFVSLLGLFVLLPLHPILKIGKPFRHRGSECRGHWAKAGL